MDNFSYGFQKLINHHIKPIQNWFSIFLIIGLISLDVEVTVKNPKCSIQRSISKEEFIIIVASMDKKDPWMKAFSGLFVEPCCD